MNNENQKKTSEVPNDLLILVNHHSPSIENNNYNLKKDLTSNKFLTDNSSSKEEKISKDNINKEESRQISSVPDEKLSRLLGVPIQVDKKQKSPDNNSNINKVNNANDSTSKNVNENNSSGMNIDILMKNTFNSNVELEKQTEKSNKWFLIASIGSAVVFAVVLLVAIFSNGTSFSFRGSKPYYQNKKGEMAGEYNTAVVTDNMYKNVPIANNKDAKGLIIKDANNQKDKCSDVNVKKVETRIEEKFDITAVNLCELDYKFALEIEKVLDKIHKEFPSAIKGSLTNLTLSNMGEDGPIASFSAAKLFAKANTLSNYPKVYKTSIYLNANYFLNIDMFDAEMDYSESSGYFISNATRYSIVAHEFGHYLSFLTQLNNDENINEVLLLTRKNYLSYYNLIKDSNNGTFSLKLIEEAYNGNAKNNEKYINIEDYRSTISQYAMAMDPQTGEYIYDETIAEAFHDWYVNKNKASEPSKQIVSVLKKYINK